MKKVCDLELMVYCEGDQNLQGSGKQSKEDRWKQTGSRKNGWVAGKIMDGGEPTGKKLVLLESPPEWSDQTAAVRLLGRRSCEGSIFCYFDINRLIKLVFKWNILIVCAYMVVGLVLLPLVAFFPISMASLLPLSKGKNKEEALHWRKVAHFHLSFLFLFLILSFLASVWCAYVWKFNSIKMSWAAEFSKRLCKGMHGFYSIQIMISTN